MKHKAEFSVPQLITHDVKKKIQKVGIEYGIIHGF